VHHVGLRIGISDSSATGKLLRITIITVGSRGDVQPFVALGKGLRDAGHFVRLATHENFEELILSYGLDFATIEGNPQEILHSEDGRKWIESDKSPVGFFLGFIRLSRAILSKIMTDALTACRDTEAIIFSPLGMCALSIAEKMNVPACMGALQPLSPTSEFASPMFPPLSLGGFYNMSTHRLSQQLVWQPFRNLINNWRRNALQLPPYPFGGPMVRMHKQMFPVLSGFSSNIVAHPHDWHPACHITGYWFLEQNNSSVSRDLIDFVESGPPPVYIGFGSMSDRNPQELSRTLFRALELSGQRGVVLSVWANLPKDNLPRNVFVVDSVPHEWLFPKMSAVIHHGGAGTTGAVFRAGVTNIVVPFFGDQFYWAHQVRRLRVGPKPIPRKQLTAENLAEAIATALKDQGMRKNAVELGSRIRNENGVARAVEIFESKVIHAKISNLRSQISD